MLESVGQRWKKVAAVLRDASKHLGSTWEHTHFPALAERIEATVRDGRLDSRGDITVWTHSEVRLGTSAAEQARKEERFRQLVQEGIDDIEAGRVIEVTDLDAFFDALEAEIDAARGAARCAGRLADL